MEGNAGIGGYFIQIIICDLAALETDNNMLSIH